MNPALSISSLPSRILASKTIAILSLALALFGLSLPVAKAQKLRIGISMKTLNAPYFAAQGKAGVPVVIIDSSIDPSADYVTVVQSNNTANGQKVGEWFADTFGDKTPHIALLSGEQGNLVGGWTTEGGWKAMEDLLTAHKDIDVVLGENDSMVLGAIKAIKEAGKQPMKDIFVFAAADGQKEALQAIKEGTYGATGLNNPKLVATTGVDILVKAVHKQLPANFPKISYTEPAAITKDNVDKYIDPNAVF